MNRDRQIAKGFENKSAQAREQYDKNKSLISEYKVKERAENQMPTPMDTDLKKEDDKE